MGDYARGRLDLDDEERLPWLEPAIEDDAVVLRVVVIDPQIEDSGRVFVCRMKAFDDLVIEAFPRESTIQEEGEYRANAAEFAREYAEANLDTFERLFEEVARRQGEG